MMYNALKRISKDFQLLESEGGSNTNVPDAENENAVINKLDRSVKLDEVDTVTFGLETDDGKIVKVYVNAEQAEAFEKALSTKLGEIDDIEEVLNELSKEYEIVDVEWPDEEDNDDEEKSHEDDGSSALDQRVYGPDNKNGQTEDSFDRNFSSSESTSESLSYGEIATIELMENATSIEGRFTTAAQLMVYHAIIDLGVPEIALARNPYRASIIKGIKHVAEEVKNSAHLKTALKSFIRGSIDFDKEAEEHAASEKSKTVKESDSDISKLSDKDLETQIKNLAVLTPQEPNISFLNKLKKEKADRTKNGVKEDMKININEEQITWEFSSDKENLTITSRQLTATLDSEETEKLIKGINNHEVTVCRDKSEEPAKKFVFSPRGSSVMVKQVGSTDGYLMTSKDIDKMLEVAAPAPSGRGEKSSD
jgi:hypothetical protein